MINAFVNDFGSVLRWFVSVDWQAFFTSRPGFVVIALAVGLARGAFGGFRGWSDGGDLSFGGGDDCGD